MQKNNEKLVRYATLGSIVVALLIITAKIFAWVITDSLSILSSLVDSSIDLLSSVVTFFAVRYALKPADNDHRFGHGKAEDIAAFSQSAFMLGSVVFILAESISRFFSPDKIQNEMIGVYVMLFSTLLILVLVSFQSYVAKRTNSIAIKADSLHYKNDLLLNALVIVSLVMSNYVDMAIIDPIIATLICVYILISAKSIGKEAFDKLMDKEFEDDDRQRIINIVTKVENIRGFHDLRTRKSGVKNFIQMHLEFDKNITLMDAHSISEEVEQKVLEIYPNSEILVHQDVETK